MPCQSFQRTVTTLRFNTAAFLIGCLGVMLVSGCATTNHSSKTNAAFDVTQIGAMRAVMREGHTEPRISLNDVVSDPHSIAVGALEGLDGEITVIAGQAWVSRPMGDTIRVTTGDLTKDDRATLLTLSSVTEWISVPIKASAQGQGLELLIEQAARANGINTNEPFPFTIEGSLTDINLHVINGYCPIATDPSTVDAQPWRLTNTQRVHAVLVGFYAPNAAGVMTHHGTSLHTHAIITVNGQPLAGHVDHVVIEPGMILRVPQ